MAKKKKSPVPTRKNNVKMLTFGQAMEEVAKGRRVTRIEWNSNQEYGFLTAGRLHIFTQGKPNQWLISDGDLLATDWVVLPEQPEGAKLPN